MPGAGPTAPVVEWAVMAASVADETTSPFLANLLAIVGFVLIFTYFATESVWSWILGGGLLLASGLWAGLSGGHDDDGAS